MERGVLALMYRSGDADADEHRVRGDLVIVVSVRCDVQRGMRFFANERKSRAIRIAAVDHAAILCRVL